MELGQLLVIAVAIPVLVALFRWVVAERVGVVIISAILAHSAWHWMTARFAVLREYRLTRPTVDALMLAGLLRWADAIAYRAWGRLGALGRPGRGWLRPECGIGNQESELHENWSSSSAQVECAGLCRF